MALGTKSDRRRLRPSPAGLLPSGSCAQFGPGRSEDRPLALSALLRVRARRPRASGTAATCWLTGNPLYPLHLQVVRRHVSARLVRAGRHAVTAPITSRSPTGGPWSTSLMAVLDPRLVPFWLAAVLGSWAIGKRSDSRRWAAWIWAFSRCGLVNRRASTGCASPTGPSSGSCCQALRDWRSFRSPGCSTAAAG